MNLQLLSSKILGLSNINSNNLAVRQTTRHINIQNCNHYLIHKMTYGRALHDGSCIMTLKMAFKKTHGCIFGCLYVIAKASEIDSCDLLDE